MLLPKPIPFPVQSYSKRDVLAHVRVSMFSHIVTDCIKVSFVLGLLYVHHMFCFTKDMLLSKVEGGFILSVMFWVR